MKAEDTVLNKLGMEEATTMGYSTIWEFGGRIARSQAEISFKAGIKEVVDYLNILNLEVTTLKDLLKSPLWQEQTKEWGIVYPTQGRIRRRNDRRR